MVTYITGVAISAFVIGFVANCGPGFWENYVTDWLQVDGILYTYESPQCLSTTDVAAGVLQLNQTELEVPCANLLNLGAIMLEEGLTRCPQCPHIFCSVHSLLSLNSRCLSSPLTTFALSLNSFSLLRWLISGGKCPIRDCKCPFADGTTLLHFWASLIPIILIFVAIEMVLLGL